MSSLLYRNLLTSWPARTDSLLMTGTLAAFGSWTSNYTLPFSMSGTSVWWWGTYMCPAGRLTPSQIHLKYVTVYNIHVILFLNLQTLEFCQWWELFGHLWSNQSVSQLSWTKTSTLPHAYFSNCLFSLWGAEYHWRQLIFTHVCVCICEMTLSWTYWMSVIIVRLWSTPQLFPEMSSLQWATP